MIEKEEKRAVNLTSDKVPGRRMGEIEWYEHGIFIHRIHTVFPIKKVTNNSVNGSMIHLCVSVDKLSLHNRITPIWLPL